MAAVAREIDASIDTDPCSGTGQANCANNNYISQQPWTAGLNHPEMWGPFGNYTTKNSGEYGSLGYGFLGYSGGAVFLGGGWNIVTFAGVFYADLFYGPLGSSFNLGFRCVSAAP